MKTATKEWERYAWPVKIQEPKRWWHYLGVKQKYFEYVISFYAKSETGVNMSMYGNTTEWK